MNQFEVLQETTDWDCLNHTYLLDKKKGWCLGYRNSATGEITVFPVGIKQFNKKGRDFKKTVDNELVRAYTE